MRNLKVNIFRATAVFLLILAAVFYYFEKVKIQEVYIDTTEVIVAIEDIPENTVIEKEMVTIEKRYTEDVMKLANIAKASNEIIGKRTIVPIYKGEPININRIVENKDYMNTKDQTQVALAINEIDKALELQQGDYIDIWLEPVLQSHDSQTIVEPHKLIEKIKIIRVHDSSYNNLNIQTTDSINKTAAYVPAYFTIELSDKELKEIYALDKNKYNVRVAKYGDEKLFRTVTEIIKGDY